jgi:hypothetical protein
MYRTEAHLGIQVVFSNTTHALLGITMLGRGVSLSKIVASMDHNQITAITVNIILFAVDIMACRDALILDLSPLDTGDIRNACGPGSQERYPHSTKFYP